MLPALTVLLSSDDQLKKDLIKYDLKDMTNIVGFERVKKAFIKAQKDIVTEQDLLDAKISLYGSLQKLKRLEINLNDIDLWFINVYKKDIKADYMYQALLNSASRRGFPCFAKFEYILAEEEFSTSYLPSGRIQINYVDKGLAKNITVDSLKDYRLFFLLLNVHSNGKLIHQEKVQLTAEEMLKIKAKSTTKDKGDLIKYWERGQEKSYLKKDESVWQQWTKQQIQKTLVKQAFRMLKESIPTLSELMQFETLEDEDVADSEKTEIVVNPTEEVPELKRIDLDNPSPDLLLEVRKIEEEYKLTPELVNHQKQKIWDGMQHCKTEDNFTMFLNSNAAIILSLGEETKNKILGLCKPGHIKK